MYIRLALVLLLPLLAAAAVGEPVYYSILLDGKRAGYSRYETNPITAGVQVNADTYMKLRLLGAPFDMSYHAVATYTGADDPLPTRYTVTVVAGQNNTTADCTFSGSKAHVKMNVNGSKSERDVDLPKGCCLLEGNLMETWDRLVRVAARRKLPDPVPVFSPAGGAVVTIKLKPSKAGQTIAEISGQAVILTADPKSGALESMSEPVQKAVFKLADKQAMANLEGVEFASRVFATTDVTLPDPEDLTTLTLSVKAVVAGGPPSLRTLRSSAQSFEGTVDKKNVEGKVTIKRYKYTGDGASTLPLSQEIKTKNATYLKPGPFIESDDPEIKALAKKLTRGSKTTWDAAQRIGKWVHENIAYKITGASAKACLQSKEGDCGPHSWLSIALLRAAGIPARITGGAMYTGLLGGSFGQHYWTKVWVGDKPGWVPIDTTSGEIGTLSPGHLTLWDGTSGIGSLAVKVVDYAPKAKSVAATAPLTRLPLKLSVGEKWEYRFNMDGKPAGTEKVEVKSVGQDGLAELAFDVSLDLPQGKVQCGGVFRLHPDGTPAGMTLDVKQSGIEQKVDASVKDGTATLKIDALGQRIDRTVDLPSGGYLGMALAIFPWDLMLRTQSWQPGKPNDISIYLVDALADRTMKWKVLREETIMVNGADTPCLVIGGSENGQLFYVRKDNGMLAKAVHREAKIQVERRF